MSTMLMARRRTVVLPAVTQEQYDDWRRWDRYPAWFRGLKHLSDQANARRMRANWRYVDYVYGMATAQPVEEQKRPDMFRWWQQ